MKVKIPKVGGIAISTQGRDCGDYYIITCVLEGGYVLLANGKEKPLSSPKRKNVKHLHLLPECDGELAEKLNANKVFDYEISSALKRYLVSAENSAKFNAVPTAK